MRLKPLLTCAALYLSIIGLGMMLVPRQLGIGAVPADAPPALIAYLRVFGGPMVGVAVLDWLARGAEPSPARRAIVVANAVGFASALRDRLRAGGAKVFACAFHHLAPGAGDVASQLASEDSHPGA